MQVWGSHSCVADDSGLLEMDAVSLGEWFQTFGRSTCCPLTCWTLKTKALWSFEISESLHPATEHHFPEARFVMLHQNYSVSRVCHFQFWEEAWLSFVCFKCTSCLWCVKLNGKSWRVKCNVPAVHSVKVCRGIELCFHLLLTLALDGFVCSISCLWHITHRTKFQYSFNRKLGGLQSHSGCFREEENLFPTRIQTTVHPACSVVHLLSYPGSKMRSR